MDFHSGIKCSNVFYQLYLVLYDIVEVEVVLVDYRTNITEINFMCKNDATVLIRVIQSSYSDCKELHG